MKRPESKVQAFFVATFRFAITLQSRKNGAQLFILILSIKFNYDLLYGMRRNYD